MKMQRKCNQELVNGQSFEPLIVGSKNLQSLKLIRCLGDWDKTLEAVGNSNHGLTEMHLEKIQWDPMDAGAAGAGVSLDNPSQAPALSRWKFIVSQQFQHLLDKTTPHVLYRWIACLLLVFIYVVRIYFVQGFYIVSYGLGIYILNLLIGFLSPQVDPEVQELSHGPTLPTRGSDEFRPFVRRLPEFKFWYSITKAFCIAFVMTFFSAFDVPVFWPILLFYWVFLFSLTMRTQISRMIKYRYVPFTFGKQLEQLEDVVLEEDSPED
ncbi:protein RER1A-like [Senna tora]|uniref:Protein RER1A-like n=1 Tax=Senna tora TaxID=362788 RepID=A0A834TUC7_9FABA|nr:protein RER1A-like [Senna tora]